MEPNERQGEADFALPIGRMSQWYKYTRGELLEVFSAMENATVLRLDEHYKGQMALLVFVDNGAETTCVFHLDTVQKGGADGRGPDIRVESVADEEGNSYYRLHHPWHDDRIGMSLAMEVFHELGMQYNILMCDHEETGGSTSAHVEKFDEHTLGRLKAQNWFFEPDRGGHDCALYQYLDMKDWKEAVESAGWKASLGSFTDIVNLRHTLGVCGLNMGVGYHRPHSADAYLNVPELAFSCQNMVEFWQENHKKRFAYTGDKKRPPTTSNYKKGFDWIGAEWGNSTAVNKYRERVEADSPLPPLLKADTIEMALVVPSYPQTAWTNKAKRNFIGHDLRQVSGLFDEPVFTKTGVVYGSLFSAPKHVIITGISCAECGDRFMLDEEISADDLVKPDGEILCSKCKEEYEKLDNYWGYCDEHMDLIPAGMGSQFVNGRMICDECMMENIEERNELFKQE
jgi:hypothetical protein